MNRAIRIRLGQVLGLLFLIAPISDLAGASLGPARTAVIAVALACFVAVYLALLPPVSRIARHGTRGIYAGLAALALLEALTLALDAPASFAILGFYIAAAGGILLSTIPAVIVVVAASTTLGVAHVVDNSSDSAIAATVLSSLCIGIMMVAFGNKIRANRELEAARHELARLAVTEERLRIARDLHDLLGHSLSIVALKTELADKLLASDPERARAEIADIQQVTRQSLADVRSAVQGYRQLALDEAVGSARTALAAAGIDCRVESTELELPSEVESVLAWAVREATTNVVRHSNASHCEIRVTRTDGNVELAVDDDGNAGQAGVGSGLIGLAERAALLEGTLEAGKRPGGGFRLRLAVPLAAS